MQAADAYEHVLRVALVLSYIDHARDYRDALDLKERATKAQAQARVSPSVPKTDIPTFHDNGKAFRLSKDFLKALETQAIGVATGKNAKFSDTTFRQAMGAFYNSYMEPGCRKKVKDERKMSLVLDVYARCAQNILVRTGLMTQTVLHEQVARFVEFAAEIVLATMGKSPLYSALLQYREKLTQDDENWVKAIDFSKEDPTLGNAPASSSVEITSLPPRMSTVALCDDPLVQSVQTLFGKTRDEFLVDVGRIRDTVSCRLVAEYIKDVVEQIHNGFFESSLPNGLSGTDFSSDDDWRFYKAHLVEIYTSVYEQMNSGPLSICDAFEGDVSRLVPFPSNAVSCFEFVYKQAIRIDYDALADLPPDQSVPLSILTDIHHELIDALVTLWGIPPSRKHVLFLAEMTQKFADHHVPESCLVEGFTMLDDIEEPWPLVHWPLIEHMWLSALVGQLFAAVSDRLLAVLQGHYDASVPVLFQLADKLWTHPLASSLESVTVVISKDIIALAIHRYNTERDKFDDSHFVVDVFAQMATYVTSQVDGALALQSEPLQCGLFLPAIYAEGFSVALAEHVSSLAIDSPVDDQSHEAKSRRVDPAALVAIYKIVSNVQMTCNTRIGRKVIALNLAPFFGAVRQMLIDLEDVSQQWVDRALASDSFESEEDEFRASSSVTDLIDSCRSAAFLVDGLGWPDDVQDAEFRTIASRAISKAIERYASRLESLFFREIATSSEHSAAKALVGAGGTQTYEKGKMAEATAAASATATLWMTRAKQVMNGEKPPVGISIEPETCVKLNNLGAVKARLDKLYNELGVDSAAQLYSHDMPRLAATTTVTTKIVLAENLPSDAARANPFLILSDSQGVRIARTRVLVDTTEPRWNESFDIAVAGDLWLRVTIWTKKQLDHSDMLAKAYLHLDPAKYVDLQSHDVWLSLETPSGAPLDDARLLVRVNIDGEQDNAQYYFGRAFVSLKRAEADMSRALVDQVLPVMRHYLSLASLDALLNPKGDRIRDLDRLFRENLDLDMIKVRTRLSEVGSKVSSVSSDLNSYVREKTNRYSTVGELIPEVRRKASIKRESQPEGNKATNTSSPIMNRYSKMQQAAAKSLTDRDIEDAIGPLLDHFDDLFFLLRQHLSLDAWNVVVSYLWKEVLVLIEFLILPPLSDKPSKKQPLTDAELDVVFKWLSFLFNFFHANGDGVPVEKLRTVKYLELLEARMYYDWNADDLMTVSVQALQRQLVNASAAPQRRKTIMDHRNLGTIKKNTDEASKAMPSTGNVVLRILRMRPHTGDFLAQQLSTFSRVADPVKGSRNRPVSVRKAEPVGRREAYKNNLGSVLE